MDNPKPTKTTYLNDEWERFKEQTFIHVYNSQKGEKHAQSLRE